MADARRSPADVRDRFAPVAANYTASWFHADPERLEEILVLCQPRPVDVVLDVATGTGNTALALAPYVARVVGLDLTRAMLDKARRLAAERAIDNAGWVIGDACQLPFAAATFDLYAVRAAPHHFHDLAASLREAHRVLKPGARAVFIDCSPPEAARDHLHALEVARDPSHVRTYTLAELTAAIEEAGLVVETAERRELDWEFDGWMRTMAVPAGDADRLAGMVESAGGEARDQLRPERRRGRLWHTYWHALIRARKPR